MYKLLLRPYRQTVLLIQYEAGLAIPGEWQGSNRNLYIGVYLTVLY